MLVFNNSKDYKNMDSLKHKFIEQTELNKSILQNLNLKYKLRYDS